MLLKYLGTFGTAVALLAILYIISRDPDKTVHVWKEFVDSLSSKGGTIVVALWLFHMSFVMVEVGMTAAERIMDLAAGAILGALASERMANGKTKSTDVKVTETLQDPKE